MKKLILSLSILLTSLSISAQLSQISEYWNIQHTNLRSQYVVNKVTNEKQGVYKAWSVDRNLILECNYAKDKLQGKYSEYYDTPGLKVSTTVNYKNDLDHYSSLKLRLILRIPVITQEIEIR